MNKTLILNHESITLKIDRIAVQILEHYYDEASITLIGIDDRGSILASKIRDAIAKFKVTEINYSSLSLHKGDVFNHPVVIQKPEAISHKAVILVDDVLNSGKTMAAAVQEILTHQPKSLKVCVLANRAHHQFPIQADFVGINLATTLKEHITFEDREGTMAVYLS